MEEPRPPAPPAPTAYRPGFLLVDVPDGDQAELVQALVHDALRRHPGKVLVYDASHAFSPDHFAATNRRHGRPEAEHATRCLVQRCITPFQWDTLLSKHLGRFLAANRGGGPDGGVALVVAFPYGRLFATDELADWERVDHLDFSLAHLPKAAATHRVPIVAVVSLGGLADQPELHRRMSSALGMRAWRERGHWRLTPAPPDRAQSPQSDTEPVSFVSVGSVHAPSQAGPVPVENVHLALSKPEAAAWDGLRPMGMSQPTVSHQIDAFAASFAAFRANLPRREQPRFDDLVAWARLHGNALNVSEDLDLTRRILLVAAIALADRHAQLAERHDALEARHAHLAAQVEARLRAVEERLGIAAPETPHDLVPVRRVPEPHVQQHGGVGQVTLPHLPAARPVPA